MSIDNHRDQERHGSESVVDSGITDLMLVNPEPNLISQMKRIGNIGSKRATFNVLNGRNAAKFFFPKRSEIVLLKSDIANLSNLSFFLYCSTVL